MVFFTCNGCGSSLKKNQVEKHQHQCRRSQNLSCMDCSKDFYGEDYKSHVKCISEEEKYSAKGWAPKAGQNKNERKQNEWIEMVQNLVNNLGNTDPELSEALQKISQHDNIPRKKPKYMNFVKSILGQRVNPRIVEHTWNLISNALEEKKKAQSQSTGQSNQKNQDEVTEESSGTKRKKDEENVEPANGSKTKRKKGEVTESASAGKSADVSDVCDQTIEDNNAEGRQSAKVKWCTIGKTILRSQDDQELALKKFQKKIIAEYLNRTSSQNNDTSVEVLWAKCLKKLSKNSKFKIHKERIKLVS